MVDGHKKMSDIHQRTNRQRRKFHFSYILFSSLIVFDIFAILNTIQPLVSGNSVDQQTKDMSLIEMKNLTPEEEDNSLLVKEFWEFGAANNITLDMKTKMKIYRDWVAITGAHESREVIVATINVFAIVILILVDLVALLALKKEKACLLVPWMIIYCTGFCTCYFRAFLLLKDQNFSFSSVFYTLGAAIGFNLVWVFVCSIFKELLKTQGENSHGPIPV